MNHAADFSECVFFQSQPCGCGRTYSQYRHYRDVMLARPSAHMPNYGSLCRMDPITDYTPRRRRVVLEDDRLGYEVRARIDSLWSVELDSGAILYYSEVHPPGTSGRPNYEYVS